MSRANELDQPLPIFGFSSISHQLPTIPEDQAFSFCQSQAVSDCQSPRVKGVLGMTTQRKMELQLACTKLLKTLGSLNSCSLTSAFCHLKNLVSRRRQTFNNIEIDNIAREKIIPYISEVFAVNLNNTTNSRRSVLEESRVSSERSRSRMSMSRSRRTEKSMEMSRDLRREFRLNLKLQKITKRLKLRKGFNALKGVVFQNQQSKINVVEVSQSSFGSVIRDFREHSMSNSRKYEGRLQAKIIGKYMKKMVMAEGFRRIQREVARKGLGRIVFTMQRACTEVFKEVLDKVKKHAKRVKACNKLVKILSKKMQAYTLSRKVSSFQTIKHNPKQKLTQYCLPLITLIDRLICTKNLKNLYYCFYRISTIKTPSPLLTTLTKIIDRKLKTSDPWEHSEIMNDTSENESFLKIKEVTVMTEVITEDGMQTQPFLEVGAALNGQVVWIDEQPIKKGSFKLTLPSQPLKPRSRDMPPQPINTIIFESIVDRLLTR